MQAAALLHDTVEDTATTSQDIMQEFGPSIARLVIDLTDISKPEDGNRATRKAMDRDKLSMASAEAQTIKYADLISNGKDIAKNDPNVIYVGGGEVTIRGNVSSGYGVFKSVDAGKTWTFSGLPNSRHIPRIVIDPNNNDIVYAAVLGNLYKPTVDRGVYKSVDGGTTWKKVLYANDLSGAFEIVLDPNNSRVLYASTWRVQRTPSSLSSGGEGSDLWKSIDSGESWTKITTNSGFPTGIIGVIGVTVSPVNSERVWAIVENQDKGGVYRSDDGGKSWTYTNSSRSLRQRAWYYSKIYADTQDIDGVYVMNVSYHKSKDGGKTFTSNDANHGDHHEFESEKIQRDSHFCSRCWLAGHYRARHTNRHHFSTGQQLSRRRASGNGRAR